MFSFLWKAPDTAIPDSYFGEAFAAIEQALCYDEVKDPENALTMYERGLNLMKEGEQQKDAKKSALYKSLMATKNNVEKRVKKLKKEVAKRAKKGIVPARLEYEKKEPIVTTEEKESEGEEEKTVEDTKEAIRGNLDSFGAQEADLIYFLPEGVQLFTINGDRTTAPTEPTSLQILRFSPNDTDSFAYEMDEPGAFIQVGPWVYPLMKNKTPILKNEFGAYVVPNPTQDSPNMMVAILLSPDLEKHLIEEFHQVLKEYADLREQEVAKELTSDESNRLSRRIANFLIEAGNKVAWGVETTTVKAVSKVEVKGEKYRATLTETETPMSINPALKGSVVYMHKGTKVVAKCTRYLLDKIGEMGVSVGKSLADGAQRRFGDGKTGGLVSGTITVLGGGITGVSTAWMALEDGSKVLCRSIANQTVQNVKIKYGDDAAETTHHALFATGHGTLAATQLWDLGPRSVAGRMARKAGIQIVNDLHHKNSVKEGAGPLPEKKAL